MHRFSRWREPLEMLGRDGQLSRCELHPLPPWKPAATGPMTLGIRMFASCSVFLLLHAPRFRVKQNSLSIRPGQLLSAFILLALENFSLGKYFFFSSKI